MLHALHIVDIEAKVRKCKITHQMVPEVVFGWIKCRLNISLHFSMYLDDMNVLTGARP